MTTGARTTAVPTALDGMCRDADDPLSGTAALNGVAVEVGACG